ncbi:MAG TPA: ankyrin repeat domain-containing protein [Pyrinomonadaceae bacterium]|nr:ankyrin repeat domain-containing protein [Pyrinomonadaceae bacterium]
MKTTAALFLALLLAPIASAQTKQELNDKLFDAVRAGDATAVTALLDKGADVNAKFRYGMTALFKAAERGNLEVTKILLARGVDVKVKDTFYGANALSWAVQNEHNEVVKEILAKDPDSVDEVLLDGTRGDSVQLVEIALAQGGAKPETLTAALVAATRDKSDDKEGQAKAATIAEMLKKAGATPPLSIDAAILQTYVGSYKSETSTINVTLKEGKLSAQPVGRPPISLFAIDKVTFKPVEFDGMLMTMTVEGDKVTGFNLKQGPNNTVFKRVQ